MKVVASLSILVVCFGAAEIARGQSQVATLALASDRIGEIRTAQGITTMIRFTEAVQEIICGDLYDSGTGKGTFVVQRSGTADHPGNEVFIKPVSSKGTSNMFVKTGDGKHTYSFDLSIVSAAQAHRMVNVTELPASNVSPPAVDKPNDKANEDRQKDFERLKGEAERDRQKAAEILRIAQQQADRKIAEADAKIVEINNQAAAHAEQEAERRFMQALMLGLREVKVSTTRAASKKALITLDPRVFLFNDKAFLRYTIQNTGDKDFTFTAISLEVGEGKDTKQVEVEVNQSKPENSLPPGESLTGVIVFDPKHVGSKQKLMLFVRGQDSAELAHLTIQE